FDTGVVSLRNPTSSPFHSQSLLRQLPKGHISTFAAGRTSPRPHPPPPSPEGGAPNPRMAAINPAKILLVAGTLGMSLGASGLLLYLAAPTLTPGLEKARGESAALAVLFLSFITGEVMAVYAVLLSQGVVPAVSTGLAKKLSWIPPALFLLALAIEVPPDLLVCTPVPMLLRLQIVGGGRAAVGGPRGGEPAGDVQGEADDVGLDEQQQQLP
ncbi:hypothetical protein Taro_048933, partial [Colocasia esculenta]|nr:hypothetical protein [Colocasia esculenta]